jgi:hypothetical protein
MAQDPWRKAYNLTRSRTPADARPGTRTGKLPADLRRRPAAWPWIALLLLATGGAGYYLWHERGVLIPKYADGLPAPMAKTVEQTPLPRQELDIAAMDGGLGIGLNIDGDYLNLIGATRGWGVEWKLVELGSGNARLTAPGVIVYAARGRISGYKLEIKEVFRNELWQPWRKELSQAGLNPELNWRTATGEAQMPKGMTEHVVTGRSGHSFAGENAESSYMLYFRDGWLTRIEAGLSTGQPVPEPIFEQPRDAGPPQAPKLHTPPVSGPGQTPEAGG